MKYLIGIDVGTSGTKTVLFDELGTVIKSKTVEYEMSQPKNGWAEQNPDDWWQAVKTTLEYVASGGEKIEAIGLSGQMHGLVMLDADGEVLRPSIIWCDSRTATQCGDITDLVGKDKLIEITANPALCGFTASKIMWVKQNEPHIYEKCRHILLPKDYIRYKLTGEFATDVSDAGGMQLLDIKNRCWSAEVLEKLDIDISLLPKVYESPEITGYVNNMGDLNGVPVVGGAGDNAAAAVGCGVIKSGKAFTTIGTSGVVFAHCDEPVIDKLGRVHTFCCAVPGKWHVMGVTQAAGLSLKYFKETFAHDLTYSQIDALATEVPIGAEKLIYLPYLMGERTPHLDPDARGVFFGLSAIHEKKHYLRAVMEGVTYSLRDCVEVLKEMNIPLNDMAITGGGAKSELWLEMLAATFNMKVKTINSGEGPAFGAAILAGVGSGVYESVETACEKLVASKKIKSPLSPEEYEKYYEVYKSLYSHLKSDFKDLATILI